jgi:hypothetical protein
MFFFILHAELKYSFTYLLTYLKHARDNQVLEYIRRKKRAIILLDNDVVEKKCQTIFNVFCRYSCSNNVNFF